ncbi:MAG: hypothetical protein K2Y28_11245 [Burkholderiaceae bacterium]|nr:hypothetical protein [Burkholderiaceae bacterium]
MGSQRNSIASDEQKITSLPVCNVYEYADTIRTLYYDFAAEQFVVTVLGRHIKNEQLDAVSYLW